MDQIVLHNLRLKINCINWIRQLIAKTYTALRRIPTKNLDSALHEPTSMVKGFIFANVSHSK